VKITVKVEGNLKDLMASEYLAGERAVTGAMRAASARLKANWRGQVSAALGSRLGGAVRGQAYPASGESMKAAALVYTKAPKIIDAFEKGAIIRAQSGIWLAIPLPAAGKGSRRGRITPGEWEQRTGRRLRFVYRRGRTGLLVDEGRVSRDRILDRNGFSKRTTSFRNRTVPIFALVRQVKLPKRLNLYAAAEPVASGVVSDIIARWRSAR
jgi:hypothetical protein